MRAPARYKGIQAGRSSPKSSMASVHLATWESTAEGRDRPAPPDKGRVRRGRNTTFSIADHERDRKQSRPAAISPDAALQRAIFPIKAHLDWKGLLKVNHLPSLLLEELAHDAPVTTAHILLDTQQANPFLACQL